MWEIFLKRFLLKVKGKSVILFKLTEIIQDVPAYLGEFTSAVCMWKTGFSLMMGQEKKKCFILACETLSRCCLIVCVCVCVCWGGGYVI